MFTIARMSDSQVRLPSHLKQVIIRQFSLRRCKACKVGNTGYPGEVLGLPRLGFSQHWEKDGFTLGVGGLALGSMV